MSWAQVRREFEQHGINGEVPITEYAAFLLLVKSEWTNFQDIPGRELQMELEGLHINLQTQHPGLQIPQPPPATQWEMQPLSRLFELLTYETPRTLNLGRIFQEDVRFELLKGQGGSQYPTPHHIADFMASLVVADFDNPHIFDPTAGSGGLLAAASGFTENANLVGCDFDPQWAGIGSANLILHGAMNATYHVGSALSYGNDYENQFHHVLMNPPFGGERGREEVENGLGTTAFGFGTANVLTALVMIVLQPGGIAAFLAPSGLLYKRGSEARLRSLFLENNLEAIVTLPPDALQPHNTSRAHLVLVQKRPEYNPPPENAVWLCVLNHDGYSAGSSRSLSGEDVNQAKNELTRTRSLLTQHRQNQWQQAIESPNGLQIETLHLSGPNGEVHLPGRAFCFVLPEAAQQPFSWQAVHMPSGVLLTVPFSNDETAWLYTPYATADVWQLRSDLTSATTWETKLPASTLAPNLPIQWQGDGDDVTFSLEPGNKALLRKGSSRAQRFEFNARNQGNVKLCLLQQDGTPLTPWWKMGSGDTLSDDFEEKFAAMPLFDSQNRRVGWLISLTTEDVNAGEDLATTWLLIAETATLNLFTPEGDDAPHYLRLDHGIWEIGQQMPELGREISFGRAANQAGFAIGPAPDTEGQGYNFFGVLVPHAALVKDGRDTRYEVESLDPVQFLPEPPPPPTPQPAKVLADIRRNQARLSTKIDSLLGVLGGDSALPVTIGQPAPIPRTLLAPLNQRQSQLWQLLTTKVEDDRPLHFHLDDVLIWCADNQLPLATDEVQQQLILFSRLGLIMEVNSQGNNWYRLVTTSDIVPRGANP